jgi:blue copper oxidase
MKGLLKIAFILLAVEANAQQPLFIPDTLSGSTINLTLKTDSVQFFPGQISFTNGYSGYKYLGKTLILKKGTNVSITVNNQLTDTTTVHWHGLHVAPQNDGGPHTMIMPGATWNPQFTVMDRASTYWYHPHFHMKTAEQVLKGAAGMIIVRDSAEAALILPRRYGIDDFPIIVQSLQFDSLNQPMPKGMEDSTLLVNGTMNPYVNMPAQVVRLRLLNASGERVLNFGFTGSMSFSIIGSDGGLLQNPVTATRARLAPGERAEVLLNLTGMNTQTIQLISYGSELPMGVQGGPTMPMSGGPPMDSPLNGIDFNILQINVVAQTTTPVITIPSTLVNVTPYTAIQANITRTINMTADSMMVMDGPFYFNGNTFDMMRIDYQIPLNNIEIWQLSNQTMVAHPFHIHDVQFYILDRDGNAPPLEERGRKDVVLVMPNETVRFITKFEDFADTLSPYMFHCHILMHEDDGMMGQFVVSSTMLGIKDIKNTKDNISVFPNPANDKISIKCPEANKKSNAVITVYNSTGQKVGDYKFNSEGIYNIDVSGWPGGIYFTTIMIDNEVVGEKKFAVLK